MHAQNGCACKLLYFSHLSFKYEGVNALKSKLLIIELMNEHLEENVFSQRHTFRKYVHVGNLLYKDIYY